MALGLVPELLKDGKMDQLELTPKEEGMSRMLVSQTLNASLAQWAVLPMDWDPMMNGVLNPNIHGGC